MNASRPTSHDFHQLTEALPQIIWCTDADGTLTYINARWEELTGQERRAAMGHGWEAVVPTSDLRRLLRRWHKAAAQGSNFQVEHRLQLAAGDQHWMMTNAVCRKDTDGTITAWIGTSIDVQPQHLAVEAMRAAKELANEANAAKSQFLANMSHEIRTPLGAILGFAELLKDDNLTSGERTRFLDTIVRNGNNLVCLIDDILDLAKVESGRVELERIRVSPTAVLAEVVALLTPRAAAKGITLTVAQNELLPASIITDPMRLRQILLNIVGNAVKFTEHGGVRLEVDCELRGGGVWLVFAVRDTGTGIPANRQAHLFQPFSQGDPGTTRRYGGTGLGLLLSQNLARLLGGDVVLLDSKPGRGSAFLITIAAEDPQFSTESGHASEAPQPATGATAARPLAGERVLLVEDSADFRALLDRILRNHGAAVDLAEDGDEAVRKATGSDYDLVLMDVAMPVKDGIQATIELRRRGFTRPIVALTAHAMKDDCQRCFAAGCNGYLTKPISTGALIRAAARYITERPA